MRGALVCGSANAQRRPRIATDGADGAFNVVDFIRSGHVCRVEVVNHTLRRIAMQFFDPLPFRPGEQEMELEQDDWSDDFELGLY